jgi:uncharacterized damage-inducible protein DinB
MRKMGKEKPVLLIPVENQVRELDAKLLLIGDGSHTTRRDHILITLFNHQTHHRGQVHAMLTQQGIDPPPLDVIYFLEEQGLS